MAASQNFRSAFNGFNREDVVHYIEYLNAKHTAEVNQLQSELDFLNTKLESARQNTQLQTQLEEALAAIEALKAERDDALAKANAIGPALEERCAQLEAQLRSAEEAKNNALQHAAKCQVEQELEAYRRAERTERMARERADMIYRQTNGILKEVSLRVNDMTEQIIPSAEQLLGQLNHLQTAVSATKLSLQDASVILSTLRPDNN